jgi:hypothetical protein
MLQAARRHDLATLLNEVQERHPTCVTAQPEVGERPCTERCHTWPVGDQYGNCRQVITRAIKTAQRGNWEATQLLILALIADVVGAESPVSSESAE